MISFTANQQRIIDAESKVVSWLFDVYKDGSATPDYRWSHKTTTYDGDSYEFRIIPDKFSGIVLNRCNKESKMHSPCTCEFSIANPYNYIDDSVLNDCKIIIKLVAEDDTGEELLSQWAFICRYPERRQQTIFFKCSDFVTRCLNGFYPKTPLYKDVFPSTDPDAGGLNDNLCIPVPIGEAYIPIRSVYITGDGRYYVLGPSAGKTYTISQVRSPRSKGANASYWDSTDYTFNQSIKTGRDGVSYTVFQPIICKSYGSETADSPGFWRDGEVLEDMPTKFSRSDTVSKTNPADVIEYFLLDIGVPSDMIDSTSFTAAASTYTSWGLSFSGAFFFRQDRSAVLSNLLTQCNSVLDCEEKVKLRVLDKSSVITVTDDDIQRKSDESTTFSRSNIANVSEDDSGYVAFQSSTEPIDLLQKYVVPADTTSPTTTSPSGDVIQLWFIHDTQEAQKIGTLHYSRKLGRRVEMSFDGMSNILGLQPDDALYVIGTDYLTNVYYASLVQIKMDLTIKVRGYNTRFDVVDWGDLSPAAITVAADTTTSAWQPNVTGFDADTSSGGEQNANVGQAKTGSGPNQIIQEGSSTEANFYGGMTAYKTGTGFWFGYDETASEWQVSVGEAGVEGFYWSPTDGFNPWGSWAGGGSNNTFEKIVITDSSSNEVAELGGFSSSYTYLNIVPGDDKNNPVVYLGANANLWDYIYIYSSKGVGIKIGNTALDSFSVQHGVTLDLYIEPSTNYAYVNASSWTYSSERRLKENIVSLEEESLTKVLLLNPTIFNRKGSKSKKLECGFIVDEVEPILPDSIGGRTGCRGIKINDITAYNTKSIQVMAEDFGKRLQDIESVVYKKGA